MAVGFVALPTGIISSGFIELMEESKKEKESNESSSKKMFCPYCGSKLEE